MFAEEWNFEEVNFFGLFPVNVTTESWGVYRAQVAANTSIEMKITVSGGRKLFPVTNFCTMPIFLINIMHCCNSCTGFTCFEKGGCVGSYCCVAVHFINKVL